jgi:hypothetical protein
MDWRAVREKLLRYRIVRRDKPATDGRFCWEYDGCRNSDGYGSIRLRDPDTLVESVSKITGKTTRVPKSWIEYAHRASAAAFNGFDLNSDEVVAHACHNPACFNPWHVRGKTRIENAEETPAERKRSNKLTPEIVDILRRYVRRHNGSANLVKFAASRGISYASVLRATKGFTFRGRTPAVDGIPARMARPVPDINRSRGFDRRKKKDIPI